jgi:hypothetical protein
MHLIRARLTGPEPGPGWDWEDVARRTSEYSSTGRDDASADPYSYTDTLVVDGMTGGQ